MLFKKSTHTSNRLNVSLHACMDEHGMIDVFMTKESTLTKKKKKDIGI